MNDQEQEQLHHWVACWKTAGARLEELRSEELPRTDTQQSLMSLAGAFESCRLHYKALPTSGLVEQQYWFRRLAEKSEADWKQEAEKAREIARLKGLDQPAIDRAVTDVRYPAV
jgi:hypothetical protein